MEAVTPAAGTHAPPGSEHPGLKRETGHIGFCGHGARVEFANVRVKTLVK